MLLITIYNLIIEIICNEANKLQFFKYICYRVTHKKIYEKNNLIDLIINCLNKIYVINIINHHSLII